MEPRKQAILDALAKFMNRRSGIEFGNYGDVRAFRAEQRSIYTDLRHARVLLAAVKYNDGIDADALLKAAQGAFSGRLQMQFDPAGSSDAQQPGPVRLTYTSGQYFPTEYRRAVCAVLASALWAYTREKCMPVNEHGKAYETYGPKPGGGLMSAGDWLRAHFRKEFGRFIAARWFS